SVLVLASSFSGVSCESGCPKSCPATSSGIGLAVYGGVGGGVVSGGEATLTGPMTVTMSCEPSANGAATTCSWPPGPVTAGTYSLLITAPGFRSAYLTATVELSPPHCGCVFATLDPSMVV